jgi:hypothetical protein
MKKLILLLAMNTVRLTRGVSTALTLYHKTLHKEGHLHSVTENPFHGFDLGHEPVEDDEF